MGDKLHFHRQIKQKMSDSFNMCIKNQEKRLSKSYQRMINKDVIAKYKSNFNAMRTSFFFICYD